MATYVKNPALAQALNRVTIMGEGGVLIDQAGPTFDMGTLSDDAVAQIQVSGMRALVPAAVAPTGTFPSPTTYPSGTLYPGA